MTVRIAWRHQDDNTASFTVSIGVTTNIPGSDTVDALLARADAAMYRAKELGRDQVVLG